MDKKIGFIGAGNMGGAIIGGIMEAEIVTPSRLIVSDQNKDNLERLKSRHGIHVTTANKEAAGKADILFLAVKPDVYPIVIDEIRDAVHGDTLIVSIAAGQTIENIEAMFGKKIRLIRVMPNTPALVGEGMAAISPNQEASQEDIENTSEIFSSIGKCQVVGEKLMAAVIGVSGSSPAYVYMFIEALADAAVMGGMKRSQAYEFAAQAVYGSAKMVMETGLHPGILKDMVCSPSGTTIAAVAQLERTGFRSAVIESVLACMKKAEEMDG